LANEGKYVGKETNGRTTTKTHEHTLKNRNTTRKKQNRADYKNTNKEYKQH